MIQVQLCATTPNSIVLCINLNIVEPFNGFYYRHALSKVCQYAISNDKAFHGLHYASIKIKLTFKSASHGRRNPRRGKQA